MSLKEVANEDHNTEVTGAAWTPNGSFSENFSTKCKANGKKILTNVLGWSPSGCTLPSNTFVGGASAGVIATALKTKCENLAPLRKGDLGVCNGSFTLTASPFTPTACTCPIEVKDAGQDKVKAQ